MTRRTSLSSMKPISEINLTPLMDLTFILLITFIITFPLIEQGIAINLPQANAEDLSSEKSRSITIDENEVMYLDDRKVTEQDLIVELNQIGKVDADVAVMIRADRNLKYGSVVKVMRILHDAGIKRMAMVTEAEK